LSDTVTNESTYEVTVRYTTTERSDDVYVIDKGEHPELETTTDRELWITRCSDDSDTEDVLVAVYARDMWACAWVREIPPSEPQDDREYHP
jgi:hypothetical protein